MLIGKDKGCLELPSVYRSKCILDTAVKVLEELIKSRLGEAMRAAGNVPIGNRSFRALKERGIYSILGLL